MKLALLVNHHHHGGKHGATMNPHKILSPSAFALVFKKLRWKAARSLGAAGVLVAIVLHPAAATAGSSLYGITGPSSVTGFQEFGTIDPTTGNFTSINAGLTLTFGHNAPVYDPTQNAFYITHLPTSNNAAIV